MKNQDITFTTILLALACFGLLPQMHAIVPAPDGCYPNYTTAEGCNALNFLSTGAGNTGLGWYSLYLNTTGSFNTGVGGGALALNNADSNTAVGAAALLLNTTGTENVALGTDALVFNDSGSSNSAVGAFALYSNETGSANTASGDSALLSNTTGTDNTATGIAALSSNTIGTHNTAIGAHALLSNNSEANTAVGSGALLNSTGNLNTAVGLNALANSTTAANTALGAGAGGNVTTASNVICIGVSVGENVSNSCFIGNIRGVTTQNANAIPVLIDTAGQLGTMSSSRRFKKEIKPMEKASEALLALKPVTFHYKSDTTDTPQFGLIAEEAAQVDPDLVVRDKNGEIYTVRYDAVNVMLLNEFLKEHRRNEEQQAAITGLKSTVAKQETIIARQQKGMEALTARFDEQAAQIQTVSALLTAASSSRGELEMMGPATKVVVNKP